MFAPTFEGIFEFLSCIRYFLGLDKKIRHIFLMIFQVRSYGAQIKDIASPFKIGRKLPEIWPFEKSF